MSNVENDVDSTFFNIIIDAEKTLHVENMPRKLEFATLF